MTLIEREKELGGQSRLAGVPPMKKNFKEAIAYMSRQTVEAGVTIKTEKPYSSHLLMELKSEIVIVATGGRPLIPSVKNARQKKDWPPCVGGGIGLAVLFERP